MTADELLDADHRTLRALLAGGHPIDPDALAGWQYRGTSLGMPAIVDRLAWKTFVKAFHRDAGAPFVRGWNLRIRQTGLRGPIEPLVRNGRPFSFGHFRVVEPRGYRGPRGADRGLLLDYGLGGNGALDPTSRLRDPVVALEAGSAELLLGWSYLDLGLVNVPTPSFFTLERCAPVGEPVPARGR
ncbi:MAG: hypothetical protein AB1689_19505 [Thermodesulfobacteriota bacterium]